MSARKKTIILISVLSAVLVMAGFASAPYLVSDSLVCSEFYPMADTECYQINMVTESGSSITGSLLAEKTALSENYYLYTFSFNDNTSTDNYSIGSFGLALDLPEGCSVSEAFVSDGGSEYDAVTALSGTELSCTSDSGYMRFTALLYSEYGDMAIPVGVAYTAEGKGLYSKVSLGEIKQNIVV